MYFVELLRLKHYGKIYTHNFKITEESTAPCCLCLWCGLAISILMEVASGSGYTYMYNMANTSQQPLARSDTYSLKVPHSTYSICSHQTYNHCRPHRVSQWNWPCRQMFVVHSCTQNYMHNIMQLHTLNLFDPRITTVSSSSSLFIRKYAILKIPGLDTNLGVHYLEPYSNMIQVLLTRHKTKVLY